MYKQRKEVDGGRQWCVIRIVDNAYIPFDPANTDFAAFKKQIMSGEAELQDADGNLMTSEQAQAFVGGLP